MLAFKKILCPVDFSEPSMMALRKAVELASHFHGELLVLHVVPDVPLVVPGPGFEVFPVEGYGRALRESAQKRLEEEAAPAIAPGLEHRLQLLQGDAAATIIRAAEEERVDLVVIATHGMSGWHRLVFGSVTERVVRFARCPVLTLKPERIASVTLGPLDKEASP